MQAETPSRRTRLGPLDLFHAERPAPQCSTASIPKETYRSELTRAAALSRIKGGLLLYLLIDLLMRYQAFHKPTSSTDAIAVLIVLMASVIIIPAGAAVTYFVLSEKAPHQK